MKSNSPNFAFLNVHDPLLATLGSLAELYAVDDPNTALLKLRQFGEALLQRTALEGGVPAGAGTTQFGLINLLAGDGLLPRDVADQFHALRQIGNDAVHAFQGDLGQAVHMLKVARELGVWFHRTFKDAQFSPGAFVRPQRPGDQAAELRDQVDQLRREVDEQRRRVEEAGFAAELEAELRREAENRAQSSTSDRDAALELAAELEGLLADERARLAAELAAAAAAPAPADEATEAWRNRARAAASLMSMGEAETRERIDQQLRDAGWEADTRVLRYGAGTRPERGRSIAIAEWPTASGPADYVLFDGLVAVAAVEAKRAGVNVPGALEQAARYSRDYSPGAHAQPAGGPWDGHHIPFLFAANGRGYLAQVQERSGVWFRDARRRTNHPRALAGWYSPEGLRNLLAQDVAAAEEALRATDPHGPDLREYQVQAIQAVEAALLRGERRVMVAMATGTGKTRVAVILLHRLLESGLFRRVLFLVDRNTLGEQAHGVFSSVTVEGTYTFTSAHEVARVDRPADEDTVVDIATVQGMVKRVLYADGGAPPVDAYDCVIVDECHRGYTLDREMSAAELLFRSEDDYISKYRRLIEYFDAVKIGLTATPAQHSTEIFGRPVFQYSYRQAVVDGYLVDHRPPTRIVTVLAEDGITWERGEAVQALDPSTQEIEVFEAPDEIRMDVEKFNSRVVVEDFNRVVCDELARHIDPAAPGKTLVFCVNDAHADLVVRLLRSAFAERYGDVPYDAVAKITGAAENPSQLVRRFRNEQQPVVAVTVDLLTTGIDVPKIVNLVFLRRVRSRILYEQMLGRATRLMKDLDGHGLVKESFTIYDAVDLYASLQAYTDMKPVLPNPSIGFEQLAAELAELADDDLRAAVRDQIVAKLRRGGARLQGSHGDDVEALTGLDIRHLADHLAGLAPAEAAGFMAAHPGLPGLLDEFRAGGGTRLLVSDHRDEVRRVEHGYGNGQRPADFLESFAEYLRTHLNEIPALTVVLQRPRDLTRQQLKELALELGLRGFTEANLRTAWQDATNQDIAATIIGYVRQAALREPLVPYEERVGRALRKILSSRAWLAPQRQWLERIGRQMVLETVVDRAALDSGLFLEQGGGFDRINRFFFDGQLEEVRAELHDEVWRASA
ncbi:type I restriction-modification system endonuclease [Longimicrobium terrae]|uniref:Type I restriction enzyme R subunit n=1 Tax=Longimicrobium terrae TaxID=1639882 RepID=A0A841GZ22_9BACT|nr:type I restriction-modification system endonuclease [Longimicrobium terrae]MBB4636473.1 type I restriction enzyme R subunit [Longimicrobium terrae]MBB6071003.1 type I restriction enzyme R subunit [Longimicrobium terrae]NNC29025.1 type I restriction-modification system endonuclease [Longimicrobium terrae]